MKRIAMLILALAFASDAHAQTPAKKDAPVDRYGDALPEGAMARLGTVRFRHGPNAGRIAVSPKGNLVASMSRFPGLRVWDADSGRLIHEFPKSASAAAFSPGGDRVFTGRELIELASGKIVWKFEAFFNPADCAAFAPDGTTVASADHDGEAKIVVWDARSGKEIQRLPHGHYITWLSFSPKDKKVLASSSQDNSVVIWNVDTGKRLHRFDVRTPVWCVSFSPDGKTLAGVSEDGMLRIWDVATGKLRHEAKTDNPLAFHVAFSPDGKSVACCGDGGIVSFWDPASGALIRKWETYGSGVYGLAFATDGKTIFTSSSGAIRRWNVETGKEINPRPCHHASVLTMKFASDGKSLLSCGQDRKVIEWDLTSYRDSTRRFPDSIGPTGPLFWRAVDFSPDGNVLAQATLIYGSDREKPGVVNLWNTRTGKNIHTLHGHKKRVTSVKLSPVGNLLASGGDDGLRLWDVESGKEKHHLFAGNGIASLAFSSDGKRLVVGSQDNRINLCDVDAAKVIRSWPMTLSVRWTACFSPDGKTIASTGDERVHVWSADTGTELLRVEPRISAWAIAYSPNARLLVAAGIGSIDGSNDFVGSFEVWEVRTGQSIRQTVTSQAIIRDATFSPDGRTLATGGADSTILLWDMTGHAGKQPTPPTPVDLDKLWADLLADAPKADRAHWTLALTPTQSVPFLKDRVRPAPPADAKQLASLLDELGSGTVSVRQQAERSLIALGEAAEAALRKSLDGNRPVEHRRRVESILEKRNPDTLRLLRAIDVLAEIGTAEIRPVLEMLVKGSPSPRVVQAASDAGRRIRK